ncbi:MAG: hypothetical protein FJ086_18045 [Deltaproteobacteria bacterium]|nr:hypothetical protein [Deltaproteobacteria bacterium]
MTTAAPALLLLLTVDADPTQRLPRDQARFALSEVGSRVDWSDAEDRVQLSARPGMPRAGETVTFSVQVGSFQGPQDTGPVVLSLRPPDGRAVVDVPLAPSPRGGLGGTATLDAEGAWTVDLRFRTTRAKHLQADLPVAAPRRFPWLELVGLGSLAAALTWAALRATSRRGPRSPPEPEAPGAPVPPPSTPVPPGEGCPPPSP